MDKYDELAEWLDDLAGGEEVGDDVYENLHELHGTTNAALAKQWLMKVGFPTKKTFLIRPYISESYLDQVNFANTSSIARAIDNGQVDVDEFVYDLYNKYEVLETSSGAFLIEPKYLPRKRR